MHCPPQGAVVGQTWVGVQMLLVGQGLLSPTVQGTTGGGVVVVRHRPLCFVRLAFSGFRCGKTGEVMYYSGTHRRVEIGLIA